MQKNGGAMDQQKIEINPEIYENAVFAESRLDKTAW